jgi:methylmalonyl-CoA mutase
VTSADHLELAAEFPAPRREEWLKGVEGVVLKGKPDADAETFAKEFARQLVHRTEDGIEIQPLYTADDTGTVDSGLPGFTPFVRGTRPAASDWEVRQRVWADVDGSNARYELEHGATGVLLVLPGAVDLDSLDRALEGVFLELAPVSLSARDWEPAARALLDLWERRGIDVSARRGVLGADPIGEHARSGGTTALDAGLRGAAALAVTASSAAPNARAIVVDGTVWHEAGATDAQELAWSTAAGATYLRALTEAGLSIDDALRQLEFRFSATADQFATIAKLRAGRRLWARVAEVAGASPAAGAQVQHADGSGSMLTRYDPWVNALRSTVACFAAGVGGADAVTIAPHDVLLQRGGSALGRRVARNTQSILLLESNLARVTDPAGGSWYVEHFTDDLARTAWAGVQEVEAAGGIASALATGLVATHLERATSARHKVLATRRRQLTGLTEFPDIGETAPPTSPPAPTSPAGTPFPPLVPVRLADDFERQRERADRHATSTGQRPLVFLVTLGPASAHTDRLTFAKNMFEVAGIRTLTGEVAAFADSGATVACLCSSNPIYQEHGANAAADLRAAGATRVYLAGRGLDIDGVDEEVGTGVDVLDALTRVLDHLGVAP